MRGEDIAARYLDLLEPWLTRRDALAGDVLDAGCGPGNVTDGVRSRFGRSVAGIDFSESMIDIAKGRYPECDFRRADVTALPYEDRRFALSYSFRTLQHVPELNSAVAELARVTRPGGRVIFDFVGMANPVGMARSLASAAPGFIYLRADRRRTISNACRSAGLVVDEWLTVQRFVDRANLEKYFGPLKALVGGLGAVIDSGLAIMPGGDRLALRSAVVARRPSE